VPLGWFRPSRDQRSQEPALSGFRFEPHTREQFHVCRADIIAAATEPVWPAAATNSTSGSVRRGIVTRLECLWNAPDPYCCCSFAGRHCGAQ
jgi:hypothetical protein